MDLYRKSNIPEKTYHDVLAILAIRGFEKVCDQLIEDKVNENTIDEFLDDYIYFGENDIETIRFNTDGSFSYYCACGNPVNDSDLCETYSYNEETKEIKLDCFETTEETITTIKVINITDTTLELDFDGEERKFEKENN